MTFEKKPRLSKKTLHSKKHSLKMRFDTDKKTAGKMRARLTREVTKLYVYQRRHGDLLFNLVSTRRYDLQIYSLST